MSISSSSYESDESITALNTNSQISNANGEQISFPQLIYATSSQSTPLSSSNTSSNSRNNGGATSSSNNDIHNSIKKRNDRNQTVPLVTCFPPRFFDSPPPRNYFTSTRIRHYDIPNIQTNRSTIISSNPSSTTYDMHYRKIPFFRILWAVFHLSIKQKNKMEHPNHRHFHSEKYVFDAEETNDELFIISKKSVHLHLKVFGETLMENCSMLDEPNVCEYGGLQWLHHTFGHELRLASSMHLSGKQILRLCDNEQKIILNKTACESISIQEWKIFLGIHSMSSSDSILLFPALGAYRSTQHRNENTRSDRSLQWLKWWNKLYNPKESIIAELKQPKSLCDCLYLLCQCIDDCYLMSSKVGAAAIRNIMIPCKKMSITSNHDWKNTELDPSLIFEKYHQKNTAIKRIIETYKSHSTQKLKDDFFSYGFDRVIYQHNISQLKRPTKNINSKDVKADETSFNSELSCSDMGLVNRGSSIGTLTFKPNPTWKGVYLRSLNESTQSHQKHSHAVKSSMDLVDDPDDQDIAYNDRNIHIRKNSFKRLKRGLRTQNSTIFKKKHNEVKAIVTPGQSDQRQNSPRIRKKTKFDDVERAMVRAKEDYNLSTSEVESDLEDS